MDSQVKKQLDTFFAQYTHDQFEKKTLLIRAGESPRGIFYLTRGNVRQYIISREGEEMTLNIYKPFSFFPMAWAVNAYANTYYFEAMNSVETWIAPKNAVLQFIKSHPAVLFDLLQRLFIGLDGMFSRLEHLMSGDATQKLITILVICTQRFGVTEKGKSPIRISLKLTHQDIASLTGLSRETVSREMMSLKQKKLIHYNSTSIKVYNAADLAKELLS